MKEYLQSHVQRLQELKQHHVHTINVKTGQREPLTHCRRKDNPKLCKSDFPRTLWLIQEAVVLCRGLLRRMGMACQGRRSKLGSLHGPMNEENLNATHPALLAATGCNSDVQLPYRFPICNETHSVHCDLGLACMGSATESQIVDAAQASQDAQAGYGCDYQNQLGAMAFNECKECMKGHQKLGSELKDERIAYIGARHTKRILSDAYGKGIVRSNQESTNLRTHGKDNDVTAAETFRTVQCMTFCGTRIRSSCRARGWCKLRNATGASVEHQPQELSPCNRYHETFRAMLCLSQPRPTTVVSVTLRIFSGLGTSVGHLSIERKNA